jgi:hypothetical protein
MGRPDVAEELGCCLLLVGGDEGLGYEGFVRRWSRVAGSAGFEGPHVSAVQCTRHLEEQSGEIVGHPHLNQRGANLIVGSL